MDICNAKKYLTEIPSLRFYKPYINLQLASYFACDLAKELKAKQDEIESLKTTLNNRGKTLWSR